MDNKEETYFGCCRSRTAEPKGESFEKHVQPPTSSSGNRVYSPRSLC